jgi:thiol-disulfide isomerase/thioredoxin
MLAEPLQVIKKISMKKLFLITIIIQVHLVAQAQDVDFVISRYSEILNQLQKIEYRAHKIDTFATGSIWNNEGYALIEREMKDSIFGFSFYGIRFDIDRSFIYDDGIGLNIENKTKSYRIDPGHPGMLGSPGGQMIAPEIFHLDSVFETRELLIKPEKFILKYKFKDNIEFDVIDRYKMVELDKKSFLVTKVTSAYIGKGNKAVHQIVLSDIKLNNEVQNSISKYKSELENYTVIVPEEPKPNPLLNNRVPDIKLPLINDSSTFINLNTGKITLLDFWEIWCGPCIKSFPDVEKIKQKYDHKIQVIGVVTQDKEKVEAMIKKKNATFLVLLGNKGTHRTFSVNSYPRYFLVDDQGIIRHEYHGFSEQIERDLIELINE